jgi:flagellar motility protein MotE (MotC chaperone)
MPLRLGRHASREITRMRLVLSPPRNPGRGLVFFGLLAAALAVAAISHSLQGGEPPWRAAAPLQLAMSSAAPDGSKQLEKQLEQTKLTLSMSEARGQELERQIDTLNQRLRETQDELTFFRKARGTKH